MGWNCLLGSPAGPCSVRLTNVTLPPCRIFVTNLEPGNCDLDRRTGLATRGLPAALDTDLGRAVQSAANKPTESRIFLSKHVLTTYVNAWSGSEDTNQLICWYGTDESHLLSWAPVPILTTETPSSTKVSLDWSVAGAAVLLSPDCSGSSCCGLFVLAGCTGWGCAAAGPGEPPARPACSFLSHQSYVR